MRIIVRTVVFVGHCKVFVIRASSQQAHMLDRVCHLQKSAKGNGDSEEEEIISGVYCWEGRILTGRHGSRKVI